METIEYIKKHNIGDRVTSTTSIMLESGFRGVSGRIMTLAKDHAGCWQYVIELDDDRQLQCDDSHLE